MSKTGRYFLCGDKVIWIIYFLLCAISIIEVYSSSSSLSYKDGNFWVPVVKHSATLFGGFIFLYGFHNIPCRWLKFYPIIFLPISVVLLVATLVSGGAVNDASRWMQFGGVSFQPSEFAKGAVVVGTALILSALQTEKGADRHAFKYIMFITVPICLLIFPENFSTASLLFLVVVLLMFIGRVPLLQIGKMLGLLAILACMAIAIVWKAPEDSLKGPLHRVSVWKGRIEAKFASSEKKDITPGLYDIEHHSQEAHANIAVASSNIIGRGPGNSVERDFLSQPFSDFIYAIVLEELGIEGGVFVLLLYIVLLFRTSRIANSCERNFPAFLAIGLALLLTIQAFINMAVAVGLFPITGQPLPFISRGGSSIIVNSIYIGMILSVSRFAKRRSDIAAAGSENTTEAVFLSDQGIE